MVSQNLVIADSTRFRTSKGYQFAKYIALSETFMFRALELDLDSSVFNVVEIMQIYLKSGKIIAE